MFNGNLISISEAIEGRAAKLVRDGRFAFVGKVPSRIEPRLVPCTRSSHIAEALAQDGISGLIVPPPLVDEVPEDFGVAVAETPIALAWEIHEFLCARNFHWDRFETDIAPSAQVDPSAYVASHDVRIGERSIVHPGAIILPRVIIGSDCAIGPGTVVGADAFEVNTQISPRTILAQAGGVWLEDHVEIQAKCTIIRATFGGFTKLGRETKLDAQIHLAHDCEVGPRGRIAACAEISGRVSIGADVFLGPNCSIANGVVVGDGAEVTLGAVVTRDVQAGQKVSGNFAIDHAKLVSHIKQIR